MDTKRPADEAPIDEGGAAVKKPKIEEGVDEHTVDEEVAIKTEEDSNAPPPPHLPPLEQKSPTQSSPAAAETSNMKVEDDEQQRAPLTTTCNCAGCGVTAEKGGPLLLFQDPEEADNLDTDEKDGESKKEVEEEKR